MTKYGKTIRTFRELRGISQEEIAKRLNLSQQAYGKIERDETKLDEERLDKVADALGVSPDAIKHFDSEKIFINQAITSNDNSNGSVFNYHQISEIQTQYLESLRQEVAFLREENAFLRQQILTIQNTR